MKLTIKFEELDAQRQRIGASLSSFSKKASQLDDREKLLGVLQEGKEVSLADIDTGPGKLLTHQGEQVLLYIKDTQSSKWILENEPENSRRFHVAECRTLDRMRREGRFERYVVTNRMDGDFTVDWIDPVTRERGETQARLKVCKNCLETLNWRGYRIPNARLMLENGALQSPNSMWLDFSIDEFLMEYATFFRSRPSRRDHEAPIDAYVDQWPQISERKRREAKWRCQQCGVVLQGAPGLLHCHHKNMVKTDNSDKNLVVLCQICHASQPGHQHMKVQTKARIYIVSMRHQQGLS